MFTKATVQTNAWNEPVVEPLLPVVLRLIYFCIDQEAYRSTAVYHLSSYCSLFREKFMVKHFQIGLHDIRYIKYVTSYSEIISQKYVCKIHSTKSAGLKNFLTVQDKKMIT